MHYNQFTIDYIEKIKNNLNIEYDKSGEAVFFPDLVSDEAIRNLKIDLQSIWERADTAINIIKTKHDSTIQAGLFGLIDDFDIALKVGLLLGDRVVLVDYLFERILLKKEAKDVDLIQLGGISSFLVSLLFLAKAGRVVIIPNPLTWNLTTKQIMREVSENTMLTPDLMSMLNMLSITKSCQLHPYTISESDDEFSSIIDNKINHTSVVGHDIGIYAYEGILAGLLSEKLIKRTEFKAIIDVPLSVYFDLISNHGDFRRDLMKRITSGGSLNADNNINNLVKEVNCVVEQTKKYDYSQLAKPTTVATGLGGGAIGLATTLTAVSSPLLIAGGLLGLSSILTGLINTKEQDNDLVISLFSKLNLS